MIDTKAIRERADKATPGPWGYYERGCAEFGYDLGLPSGTRGAFERKADADFIAHAREDVPALLDALAAEQAKSARLAKLLNTIIGEADTVAGIVKRLYEGMEGALEPDDLGEAVE